MSEWGMPAWWFVGSYMSIICFIDVPTEVENYYLSYKNVNYIKNYSSNITYYSLLELEDARVLVGWGWGRGPQPTAERKSFIKKKSFDLLFMATNMTIIFHLRYNYCFLVTNAFFFSSFKVKIWNFKTFFYHFFYEW